MRALQASVSLSTVHACIIKGGRILNANTFQLKFPRLPPSLAHFTPSYREMLIHGGAGVVHRQDSTQCSPLSIIYTHTHTHAHDTLKPNIRICPPHTDGILCTSLPSVFLRAGCDSIVIACFQPSRARLTGSSFSLQEVHFPFKLPTGTTETQKRI